MIYKILNKKKHRSETGYWTNLMKNCCALVNDGITECINITSTAYRNIGQFGNEELALVAVRGKTIAILYVQSITDRLHHQHSIMTV